MITAAIKVECPQGFNNELILEATGAADDVGLMVREASVRNGRLDLVVEFEPDDYPLDEDEAEAQVVKRLDQAAMRGHDLDVEGVLILPGATDFRLETDYERQERLMEAMEEVAL